MNKWLDSPASRRRVACLALFFGTFLLFSRAMPHDFLDYDDPDYVTQNSQVHSGFTGTGVRWAFTTDTAGNWHPLTWLSHMLDWQLSGNNPHGHHATNVLLHALNAVLAFLALRKLTGAFWTSAASAALFAWHPLRAESVAWIAERKDVLSGFFFMLTLLMYAYFAEKSAAKNPKSKIIYGATLVSFALGLLSKPMLVTLPFVLLLLDFWPLQRLNRSAFTRRLVEKIPFFLLSVGSCVVTYLAQKNGGAVVETLGFWGRLVNAAVSVAGYLGKFLWPFNLAVGYPRPEHWPVASATGAALLVFAITGIAFLQKHRRPWLLVGWLWFLGMLVPVIGLVQVGLQAMADRYTYLPVLGLQLALLWMLRELFRQPVVRQLAPIVATAVLAGCAARTWHQLAVWQNSHMLYEHALAVTKDNYLAESYLGTTLFNEDRFSEAELHFRCAIEIKPDYAVAHLRLGVALEKMDRPDEALAIYAALLKIRPNYLMAHYNSASALVLLNRDLEALPHYEKTIQLKPDFEEAWCHYADSLRALGRLSEACAHYRQALTLQPKDANAHYGLGAALEDLDRTGEALASYQETIRLKPDYAPAHYNIGAILLNRNQTAEAEAHFLAVVQNQPEHELAHLGLGLAAEQLGNHQEAIAHYERVLAISPDNAEAQCCIGVVLRREDKLADAIPHFEKAVQLQPDYAEAHAELGNALYQRGRAAEAVSHLEQALRLSPDFPGVAEVLAQARKVSATIAK